MAEQAANPDGIRPPQTGKATTDDGQSGSGRSIQPPKDPFLRAVWWVRRQGLSVSEQMALLALWRILRKGPRQIGAGLLASVLHVSVGTAKNLFCSLQRKGYLWSSGKFQRGRQGRATRRLTGKVRLPNIERDRSQDDDHSREDVWSPTNDSDRSSDCDTVLEVRHAWGDGRCRPGEQVAPPDDEVTPGEAISIAALVQELGDSDPGGIKE